MRDDLAERLVIALERLLELIEKEAGQRVWDDDEEAVAEITRELDFWRNDDTE